MSSNKAANTSDGQEDREARGLPGVTDGSWKEIYRIDPHPNEPPPVPPADICNYD